MDYRKIIIVGETNIGRSFMAECILRGILQKRNCQNIEVVSRGLVVLFSEPVAPGAAKILREKGYSIENFRSAQLTEEDLALADLVLTITKGLAEQIKESFDVQTASYMSIGTFIDIDSTEAEEKIPKVTEEDPETYQQCFDILEPLMEATELSENFLYDTKKEGLYFFKDACVDHSVGNQYADLYIPLYDHWKVFI